LKNVAARPEKNEVTGSVVWAAAFGVDALTD
jgi:hypothetical protein